MSADLLVFEGADPDGIEVRVAWESSDPETLYVFTRAAGERPRWSRRVECHRVTR
jgi:hypothetical protein